MKIFKCDFPDCEKSFSAPGFLKQHKKTHFGTRDLLCHLCEKAYYNNKDLQIHLNVVHKTKTYFCELCEYKNSRRDYIGNHLKSVHSILDLKSRTEILKRIKVVQNPV